MFMKEMIICMDDGNSYIGKSISSILESPNV